MRCPQALICAKLLLSCKSRAGRRTGSAPGGEAPRACRSPHALLPACNSYAGRGAPLPTASCHEASKCPQNLFIPRLIVSKPGPRHPGLPTAPGGQSPNGGHFPVYPSQASCMSQHQCKELPPPSTRLKLSVACDAACTTNSGCSVHGALCGRGSHLQRDPVPRCRQTQNSELGNSLGTFINPRLGQAALLQLGAALCLG